MSAIIRCAWCGTDPFYTKYHDEEWGVPVRDDIKFYERICLEGAQAGLSWITILRKREHYRKVFDGFDPTQVAVYDEDKIASLLTDPGIIRNRLKITSAINNARALLKLQDEIGSFDAYLWKFVGGVTKRNEWRSLSEIPAETPESRSMSKDLKKRGFTFVGPTICYALMQACGLVNDHIIDCFRHVELEQLSKQS